MQWFYGSAEVGDIKAVYCSRDDTFKLILCTKEDVGLIIIASGTLEEIEVIKSEYRDIKKSDLGAETFDKMVRNAELRRGNNSRNYGFSEQSGKEAGNVGLFDRKSSTHRTRSLQESIENIEKSQRIDRKSINNEADSIEAAFSMSEKDSKGNELTKESRII